MCWMGCRRFSLQLTLDVLTDRAEFAGATAPVRWPTDSPVRSHLDDESGPADGQRTEHGEASVLGHERDGPESEQQPRDQPHRVGTVAETAALAQPVDNERESEAEGECEAVARPEVSYRGATALTGGEGNRPADQASEDAATASTDGSIEPRDPDVVGVSKGRYRPETICHWSQPRDLQASRIRVQSAPITTAAPACESLS